MRLDAPRRMQVFFHGFPLHAARRAKAIKTRKNQTKTQRFPRKQKAIQKDYAQMKQRKEERKERSREKIEEKNPPPPPASKVISVFHLAGRKMGLTDNDVDEWIEYQKHTEWTYPSGRPVTAQNFHRSLRMWGVIKKELARKKSNNSLRGERAALLEAKREQGEAKRREEARKRRDELAASEAGWVLCAEECRHCDGVGCSRGIKIPPAHQSWPKPPRECPAFKAKEVS